MCDAWTHCNLYDRSCHLIDTETLYVYIHIGMPIIPEHLRLSWPWSYGSWMYNYLCNQWLSTLILWVRISTRTRCTTLCAKVCQWLATGRWFSPATPVSSTNKTDRHDITEILLKVPLNDIKQTTKHPRYLVGFVLLNF